MQQQCGYQIYNDTCKACLNVFRSQIMVGRTSSVNQSMAKMLAYKRGSICFVLLQLPACIYLYEQSVINTLNPRLILNRQHCLLPVERKSPWTARQEVTIKTEDNSHFYVCGYYEYQQFLVSLVRVNSGISLNFGPEAKPDSSEKTEVQDSGGIRPSEALRNLFRQ